MNWKSIGERLMWTVVQSAAGALATAQVLDIDALKAAGIAAATAGIAFVSLLARDMLGKLDQPGQ